MEKLLTILAVLSTIAGAGVAFAQACPQGYQRECRTDPCAEKRVVEHCVRTENGVCVDSRQETVCVPRTVCTCER